MCNLWHLHENHFQVVNNLIIKNFSKNVQNSMGNCGQNIDFHEKSFCPVLYNAKMSIISKNGEIRRGSLWKCWEII